jgi:hypothetical protein
MVPPEERSVVGGGEELCSLAEAVCNGTITAAQYERLNSRLSADEDAARFYATYVRMHALLLWRWRDADVSPDPLPALPLVVEASPLPLVRTPLMASLFSTGGYVFSYSLAAFIVGIGLLIGWMCQVPVNREVASNEQHRPPKLLAPEPKELKTQFVGQITGMFDCQWANSKTGVVGYTRVPLGRKFDLASGLMEITYDSGARVILQGPCSYQVESGSSGYLAVGKMTARIKKKGEGGSEKAEDRQPTEHLAAKSPVEGASSALFSVRTPTATVTDLGTEFGVEVDKAGCSKTYVCEGTVEMRAVGSRTAQTVLLKADESARVDVGKGDAVTIVRNKGEKNAFVREMPKSAPIVLFNTGVGLKKYGDADPHWQIVARSDDPKFKPRPALLRGPSYDALENDPQQSQWISLISTEENLPEEVVYMFRTTFDLTGTRPSTAVVRGKLIADDRVVAIRLNGRSLAVPSQAEGGPFFYWTQFRLTGGFVKGTNVLEFGVLNADPTKSPVGRRNAASQMRLRVELEGEAVVDPGLPATGLPDKPLAAAPNKDTISGVETQSK